MSGAQEHAYTVSKLRGTMRAGRERRWFTCAQSWRTLGPLSRTAGLPMPRAARPAPEGDRLNTCQPPNQISSGSPPTCLSVTQLPAELLSASTSRKLESLSLAALASP